MNTFFEDFQQRSELSRYPIERRTKHGFAYRNDKEITWVFSASPVNYKNGSQWSPITLKPDNDRYEGIDFGWNGEHVCYKGTPIMHPKNIIINGKRIKIKLRKHENKLISDVGKYGTYEIVFSENGTKENLIINDPIDATIEFDIDSSHGGHSLKFAERFIVGERESRFDRIVNITSGMKFPLVIDPIITTGTTNGYIHGDSSVSMAAARATAIYPASSTYLNVAYELQALYTVERSFISYDTSGILDTDVISRVFLTAYHNYSTSFPATPNYSIRIVNYDWSASDPVTSANMETVYDGILASTVVGTLLSIARAATAGWKQSSDMTISSVNLTGKTYFGLISSLDIAGTTIPSTLASNVFTASNSYLTVNALTDKSAFFFMGY